MRRILFALLASLSVVTTSAQQNNFWTSHGAGIAQVSVAKNTQRASFPADYKLFDLNMTPFRQEMMSVTRNTRNSTIIALPNADGVFEDFEVTEASNFEPALQAKYPDIRSFSGKGITDKFANVRLSISSKGMQSMVLRANREDEYIES
jgi:hypothetical protein